MERDLIIVRAGRRSLHPQWKRPGSDAPWDVYVCPYEELAPAHPDERSSAVIPGPKWSGVSQLLSSWDGWRQYRYVMLADDDLFLLEEDVTAFFRTCVELGAKLAQPALSENSYGVHPVVWRNGAFVHREVTFVEVMLPTFRSEVLADLLWTLGRSKTGWGFGLDGLWPHLLGYQDIYVIDAHPVFHTRPVGKFRSSELAAAVQAEMAEMFKEHGCRFRFKTLRGRLTDGGELTHEDPRMLYTLVRGYDWLFQRDPEMLLHVVAHQAGATRIA